MPRENRKFYTIADNKQLIRDADSKALLMTDQNVLAQDKARRNLAQKQKDFDTRLSNLEQGLDEIKILLRQLANK